MICETAWSFSIRLDMLLVHVLTHRTFQRIWKVLPSHTKKVMEAEKNRLVNERRSFQWPSSSFAGNLENCSNLLLTTSSSNNQPFNFACILKLFRFKFSWWGVPRAFPLLASRLLSNFDLGLIIILASSSIRNHEGTTGKSVEEGKE